MKIETWAVHAAATVDPATGAVTAPIHLSTTFERNPDGEYPRGYSYCARIIPTRHALEECLASLENGKRGALFIFRACGGDGAGAGAEPGDRIIAPDDVLLGAAQGRSARSSANGASRPATWT